MMLHKYELAVANMAFVVSSSCRVSMLCLWALSSFLLSCLTRAMHQMM